MTQVTASELQEWKDHFITKAFLYSVHERIEEAKELLAEQAGVDAVQDNLIRGMIRAFREVLLFSVEHPEEENE